MLVGLIGVFLLGLLAYTHILWNSKEKPSLVDVDKGLPFPAIGQGSTIFSLSALFGAFLGVFTLVGYVALLSATIGAICGLLYLKNQIKKMKGSSFHDCMVRVVQLNKGNRSFIKLVIVAQLGIATSELIIMKNLLEVSFSVSPYHAAIFTISLALVCYFYSVFGGYTSVYRTDMVQFFSILLMCIILLVMNFHHILNNGYQPFNVTTKVGEYWSTGIKFTEPLYRLLIGYIMGFAYVVSNPDTWKRVFVVHKVMPDKGFRMLLLSGMLPFMTLVICLFGFGGVTFDSLPNMEFIFKRIGAHGPLLKSLVCLGFVSSFLSSFDSSLVVSAHFAALNMKKSQSPLHSIDTYYLIHISLMFMAVCLIFFPLITVSIHNSYYLSNFLAGLYAIIASYLVATNFMRKRISAHTFLVMVFVVPSIWFVYLLSVENVLTTPSPHQINTIPGAALVTLVCFITFSRKARSKC